MAIFAGGLVQFIVGIFELPRGNVFGATGKHPIPFPMHQLHPLLNYLYHSAWLSYGSFWLSYATILFPGSGVAASYKDPKEMSQALGLYLMVWFIVTVLFV